MSGGMSLLLAALALAAASARPAADESTAVTRAMGLVRAGETREAVRGLEAYLAENPAAAAAWFALGECRRDLLDTAGAVEATARAREIEPRNAEYALALGNLRFVRLEKDLALAAYEAALAIDPENAFARENADSIRLEADLLASIGRRRFVLFAVLAGEVVAITAALWLVGRPGSRDVPASASSKAASR